MVRKQGGLPAGLVKGVDPSKAGTAEMFARFLAPSPDTSATTPGPSEDAESAVVPAQPHHEEGPVENPAPAEPAGDHESNRHPSEGVQDDGAVARGSDEEVGERSPAADAAAEPDPEYAPDASDVSPRASSQRAPARGVAVSPRRGVKRSGEVNGRSTGRGGVEFPQIPPPSALPSRLDAGYIPRQLFIRLPVDLRDRLREVKSDLAENGNVLTDGEIVEAGCRLLPTDLDSMFHRCLNYAMRRERGAVPFSPQVRTDLHAWLENVNACLRAAGLRVSVNTIALTALEAFVDAAEGD